MIGLLATRIPDTRRQDRIARPRRKMALLIMEKYKKHARKAKFTPRWGASLTSCVIALIATCGLATFLSSSDTMHYSHEDKV